MSELKKVEKATAKVAVALEQQRVAILAARHAGASTRQIAGAAGVSHTQVQRILSRRACPECGRDLSRTKAGALACFYGEDHESGDAIYL